MRNRDLTVDAIREEMAKMSNKDLMADAIAAINRAWADVRHLTVENDTIATDQKKMLRMIEELQDWAEGAANEM